MGGCKPPPFINQPMGNWDIFVPKSMDVFRGYSDVAGPATILDKKVVAYTQNYFSSLGESYIILWSMHVYDFIAIS